VLKGLDYSKKIHDFFINYGFNAFFEVHVADVEGLDPIILANTNETTESFFTKTNETIKKAQTEVINRGYQDFISIQSMQKAFDKAGMKYVEMQREIASQHDVPQSNKVNKDIINLINERTKVGDFNKLDIAAKHKTAVTELAGYAAYGKMIGGRAIILSPDAMSAIPAYHYSLNKQEQFSPVFYAR
jgi:hypothetical protein